MSKPTLFAASGSFCAEEHIIMGQIADKITFESPEFTGTMSSQEFWDRLAEYAKSIGKYVVLMA